MSQALPRNHEECCIKHYVKIKRHKRGRLVSQCQQQKAESRKQKGESFTCLIDRNMTLQTPLQKKHQTC